MLSPLNDLPFSITWGYYRNQQELPVNLKTLRFAVFGRWLKALRKKKIIPYLSIKWA
jgi:hypothetical protein